MSGSTFVVRVPDSIRNECEWLLRIVFKDFLGLKLCLETTNSSCLVVEHSGDGKSIEMAVDGLLEANDQWLRRDSILAYRQLPLDTFGKIPAEIEKCFGDSKNVITIDSPRQPSVSRAGNVLRVDCDLLSTLFFIQSRYEECVPNSPSDIHGRFPGSKCSHQAYLVRPVADEIKWLIWGLFSTVWPQLPRPRREYRVVPSHDIDNPSIYAKGSPFRSSIGLMRRGSLAAGARTIFGYLCKQAAYPYDGYDNLDWIMDQSEDRGLQSTFFYIPEVTHDQYDPKDVNETPQVREQWKRILSRGHALGVHPGYETMASAEWMARAMTRMQALRETSGLEFRVAGSRQHGLRWQTPKTARMLESFGVAYDSTLGYADRIGFRAGTCLPYPFYDCVDRRTLDLEERPLILMDSSLTERAYEGKGYGQAALDHATEVKRGCQRVCGDFNILWHNIMLTSSRLRRLYTAILDN
jgi:hypothetical protein